MCVLGCRVAHSDGGGEDTLDGGPAVLAADYLMKSGDVEMRVSGSLCGVKMVITFVCVSEILKLMQTLITMVKNERTN